MKAGLILPLDKYAEAYGWADSFTPETLQQFTWTDDGATFGEGDALGVAQTGQSVGVFANKEKLDAAGIDPARSRPSTTSRTRWPRCASRCPPTSR